MRKVKKAQIMQKNGTQKFAVTAFQIILATSNF